MTLRFTIATAAVLVAGAANAAFTPYTDRASFNAVAGPIVTETFESCGTNTVGLGNDFVLSSAHPGPCSALQPGVSYAPDAGNDLYIAGPGQSANPTTALGVDFPPDGNNTITFASGTFAVGADIFQNFGGGFQSGADATDTVSFYGAGGLLGTVSFPVPSGTGTFYGVTSTVAITSLQISQAGGFAVIDNLSFNPQTVPEPAALALLGLGVAGLAARRRAR